MSYFDSYLIWFFLKMSPKTELHTFYIFLIASNQDFELCWTSHDQSLLVKNFNRGQKVDHGSILA